MILLLLTLLTLLTLPSALPKPSPLPPPPPPSTCDLSPDSPPKGYRWTPEHPVNLWELAGRFQGDLVGRVPQRVLSRGERCVLRQGVDYWPDAVVPMDIQTEGFGWSDIRTIKKALSVIEDKTCIRFPPRNESHTSYVEMKGNLGYGECWSYLGMLSGNQTLSLGDGCVNIHHVLHEVCHALGLVHEHSAPDRDEYIDIHWENVDPEFIQWFDKYTWDEYTDLGLGYDLYSVMHYSAYIASNNGKPTISAKDPNVKIEERTTLSEKDIKKLNMLYCNGKSFTRQTHHRTYGGLLVDLVSQLPLLVTAVSALWLLVAAGLAGKWFFSWFLGVDAVPDNKPEQDTTNQKPPIVVK